MKAHKIIASFAAVLFTTATLSAVNYNVDSRQAPASEVNQVRVTNLAPIMVHPSAADRRTAALFADVGVAGIAAVAAPGHMGGSSGTGQFNLIGSQLAMPYYSFGNKFGRISKE